MFVVRRIVRRQDRDAETLSNSYALRAIVHTIKQTVDNRNRPLEALAGEEVESAKSAAARRSGLRKPRLEWVAIIRDATGEAPVTC